MQDFTFHRDDLVPEEIDTEEKLKAYQLSEEVPVFEERQKVRNIHNLKYVMIIRKKIRNKGKLEGFHCYWWE